MPSPVRNNPYSRFPNQIKGKISIGDISNGAGGFLKRCWCFLILVVVFFPPLAIYAQDKPRLGEPTPPAIDSKVINAIEDAISVSKLIGDEDTAVSELEKLGRDALPYYHYLIEKALSKSSKQDVADPRRVRVVLRTLGNMKDAESLPVLTRAVKEGSQEMRLSGIQALKGFNGSDILPLLIVLLQDSDSKVWNSALEILYEKHIREGIPDLRKKLLETLSKAQAKVGLIVILGKVGGDEVEEALGGLLQEEGDVTSQVAELSALVEVGNRDAIVPVIRPLLSDTSRDIAVRKEACLALGRLKDKESIQDLIELLREDDEGLRRNVHWALQEVSSEKLPLNYELWKKWWAGRPR